MSLQAQQPPTNPEDEVGRTQTLAAGWMTLRPGNSEVQQNLICQQVALSAGATSIFFASFMEFTTHIGGMPTAELAQSFEEVQKDTVEAYINTFQYSILFGDAIRSLGMLPARLQALDCVLEMEVEDEGGPLSQEEVESATCMRKIQNDLEILESGAQEAVTAAMEILKKAIELQSKGTAWESKLDQEQAAKQKYDGLVHEISALESEEDFLENKLLCHHTSNDCSTCARHIGVLEEALISKQQELVKDKELAAKDAQAYFERRLESWDREKETEIKRSEDYLRQLDEKINQGGIDSGECEIISQAGWIWGTWQTKVEKKNLKLAVEAQKNAQEAHLKILALYGDDQRPSNMGVDGAFKQNFEWAEERIRSITAEKDTATKKLEELEAAVMRSQSVVQAREALLASKQEELSVAQQEWQKSRAQLEEAMGSAGIAPGLPEKICKAYKAGLMIQQAMGVSADSQKSSVQSLTMFKGTLDSMLAGIVKGKTADSQMKRLRMLMRKLAGEDVQNREAAVALGWLSNVAGMYTPLPAPQGITKKMVLDAANERMIKAKAEDAAPELENVMSERIVLNVD